MGRFDVSGFGNGEQHRGQPAKGLRECRRVPLSDGDAGEGEDAGRHLEARGCHFRLGGWSEQVPVPRGTWHSHSGRRLISGEGWLAAAPL